MKKLNLLAATSIAAVVVGCGGGESPAELMDMAEYMPSDNVTKEYLYRDKYGTDAEHSSYYTEDIVISDEVDYRKYTTFYTDSDSIKKIDRVYDNNITTIPPSGYTITSKRYAHIGETIIDVDLHIADEITINYKCNLVEKLTNPTIKTITFNYNVLKIKCIATTGEYTLDGETHNYYDIAYRYVAKGKGVIAEIDDSCKVHGDINDRNLDTCSDEKKMYQYDLWQEEE